MSQHIDPTPKQTDLASLNDRITSLHERVNIDPVSVTNINSNMTMETSYRMAYKSGNLVHFYTQINVTSQIAAWQGLFKIADSRLKPTTVQRMEISGKSVYITADGTVNTQMILPVGYYAVLLTYFTD